MSAEVQSASSSGQNPATENGGQKRRGGGKKRGGRIQLKTPKGTKDYGPFEMKIREKVMETIRGVFRKHGGTALETPVFELRDTLTGKYGEDSKLIYDLADQGGELCSLRYDLTVPFARYMAMNTSIVEMKRYSIGRVYRRDQPVMTKGRFREFYQCDFDIAGAGDPMVHDAEVLAIAVETLRALDLGMAFRLKLNHRALLDGIFEVCGVPAADFRPICSAVDKLDKLPWDQVREEMTETKGLAGDVADRIGVYVQQAGEPKALLEKLRADEVLMGNKRAKSALDQLGALFAYAEAYGVLDAISFDLSLARGLDYYTGMIFEAVLLDKGLEMGSISGGGRYDNLIKMFKGKGAQVPAVGFSLGIERIFTIVEKKARTAKNQCAADSIATVAQFPCNDPPSMYLERLRLLRQLWDAGIPVESAPRTKQQLSKQLNYAEKRNIPFVLIVGDEELEKNVVVVKNMRAANDDPKKQQDISRDEIIAFLKEKMQENE